MCLQTKEKEWQKRDGECEQTDKKYQFVYAVILAIIYITDDSLSFDKCSNFSGAN